MFTLNTDVPFKYLTQEHIFNMLIRFFVNEYKTPKGSKIEATTYVEMTTNIDPIYWDVVLTSVDGTESKFELAYSFKNDNYTLSPKQPEEIWIWDSGQS